VILVSTAGMAVHYVIMALAPNLWWLAIGRVIAGVTSASITTLYAYMADVTPPEGRARAYGLIGAAFSSGFVAGPLLGGLLGEASARAPFWLAAVLSVAAFFYGLFVLPESLLANRRMAFSWRRASPVGALQLLRSHRELSGLALVNFLIYFAYHVFTAVFVLYAMYRYEWSLWDTGILLAGIGVLDALVQGVLVGPLAQRWGDRGTMIFGILSGALGVACMAAASSGWLFAVAVIPNALRVLALPTLQALMTRRVSSSEQGQLQGANMSMASIAGVVAPLVFGAIYAVSLRPSSDGSTYPGAAFGIAALVLLAAGALSWVVGQRANRESELRIAHPPSTSTDY
jgi:DHA1 family tetracycline resistance protein-like MFS transporter